MKILFEDPTKQDVGLILSQDPAMSSVGWGTEREFAFGEWRDKLFCCCLGLVGTEPLPWCLLMPCTEPLFSRFWGHHGLRWG